MVTCPEWRSFRGDLLEGAKGVQLAEAGIRSWKERKWINLQPMA